MCVCVGGIKKRGVGGGKRKKERKKEKERGKTEEEEGQSKTQVVNQNVSYQLFAACRRYNRFPPFSS